MKTTPMAHQVTGRELLRANPMGYALGAEQGTGKTWMVLDDAEHQANRGRINAMLVVAPKGVHTNWIRREIPKHLSIPVKGLWWTPAAAQSQKQQRALKALLEPDNNNFIVLAMNVDAFNSPKGKQFAKLFLAAHVAAYVIDESQRIKNPDAARTKSILSLRDLSHTRRIASGTMMTNGPQNLFSQFEFLHPGALGTRSYKAFTSEYCELLPRNSQLVQDIIKKMPEGRRRFVDPIIIRRDSAGRPVYKNLEKLHRVLQPWMYRVLKADCLDLPPKVAQTVYFDLPTAQRKIYDNIKADLRFQREDGIVDVYNALTLGNKLMQVASGFIMVDGEVQPLVEQPDRMKALLDVLEDVEGQFIIWAVFVEQIEQIVRALKLAGISTVSYYGATSDKDREAAVDGFQAGEVRAFVANPAAAGTGLTLTAAQTAIYYSRDFDLEKRLQSEDRNHRIGTVGEHVLYIDICAVDTIDERVTAALQHKLEASQRVIDGGLPREYAEDEGAFAFSIIDEELYGNIL